MHKRTIILIIALSLAAPLMFYGCGSGSDGANGVNGINGTNGTNGTNGSDSVNGPTALLDKDSTECTLCHGPGKFVDVARMHNTFVGQINATITDVTFGAPVGIQVPVSIFFNVTASDQSGNPVTLNLLEPSPTNPAQLRYVRLLIAKLVPGFTFPEGGKDPDQWYDYGSLRLVSRLVSLGGGNYRYDVEDNIVTTTGLGNNTAAAAYDPSLRHRVGIIISGLPQSLFSTNTIVPAPVENVEFDKVPNGSVAITKSDVTTAGCQNCHFALGQNKLGIISGPASADFHGGARFEAELCVLCHNPTLGTNGDLNLVNLVHKIHTSQVIRTLDFTEVTYPQDVRNCTTCHKGSDPNWNTRPSIEACGACHSGTGVNFDDTEIPGVNFATGVGHAGGAYDNNATCFVCHPPLGGLAPIITAHANPNQSPNNPAQPVATGGAFAGQPLKIFQYFIDNVTVRPADNAAVIEFHITLDNVPLDLTTVFPPVGFTGSPAFLLAFAAPQDGIAAPADYNNFGNSLTSSTGKAGQPVSVGLDNIVAGLGGNTLTGSPTRYTATLGSPAAVFPVGASMRAVALQGYFSQINALDENGDGIQDNVGRHTEAVMKPVSGDAVRRTIVKSGYVNGQPVGCLECHEVFEGHGGNRVNNVQVCVMCHNPNLTSSGRTINPASATPINPVIVAKFGDNPLLYPEVPNNMRELIHGLHAGQFRRVTPFDDIRNRTTGGFQGVYVDGAEIRYPGFLGNCLKCHVDAKSFSTVLTPNLLLTTARITTGDPAETRTQIIAARNSVPNATDLVNSPTASACGHCHNSPAAITHFQSSGGSIKVPRGVATIPPPTLLPDVLATP